MVFQGYEWAKGSQIAVDAELAGVFIDKVKAKHGGQIKPADLVVASKRSGPLRKFFQWDDRIAGEAFRCSQAAYVLRSIKVLVHVQGEEPSSTRALVNLEVGGGDTYVSVVDALADPEQRRQLLERAKRELIAFKVKYGQLKELAAIFAATDDLVG